MRLLGLAPGGVCLAANITARAGSLLHYRFTLTANAAIHFSVALVVGSPRLAVSQHRALRSTDFPQYDVNIIDPYRDRPTNPDTEYCTANNSVRIPLT